MGLLQKKGQVGKYVACSLIVSEGSYFRKKQVQDNTGNVNSVISLKKLTNVVVGNK